MEDFERHHDIRIVSHPEDLKGLSVGERFLMNGIEHQVDKIESGTELGKGFGLKIDRNVPVLYLKGISKHAQGGYQPVADIVVIFENNTDATTLEHELVHAVEWHAELTPGLIALYEKAKEVIEESSFDGDLVNFNFMKNIHEFIADGKTKLAPVLQKEGLYNDFERETEYIFK